MNTILRKQFLAHVGQTSPSPMLVEVARAEGSFFYTPDGKRYYDLVAGVSVSNVGHCNPDVVRAVQEQAARYMHVMVYGEMVESPQVTYAARIAAALPAPLDSVYFVNSGAEAVEGALKLAKRVTERTELVSMRRAYHGSTHGAMSMMGTPEGEEWKAAFRPLLPDVRAIEFNDFEALDRITRRTAAVLVEPVQGEAGVRLPAAGWLEALRERCDRTGALLVFDEIQTGLGRTGALFAMQRYGITPDIVCLAKAFGGDESYGILLRDTYGRGQLLTLAVPDAISDIRKLPQTVLTRIRAELCCGPVYLDAPAQISLFPYDNDTFCIYPYACDGCAAQRIRVRVRGVAEALCPLEAPGREVKPLYVAPNNETVFELMTEPGEFAFYAIRWAENRKGDALQADWGSAPHEFAEA